MLHSIYRFRAGCHVQIVKQAVPWIFRWYGFPSIEFHCVTGRNFRWRTATHNFIGFLSLTLWKFISEIYWFQMDTGSPHRSDVSISRNVPEPLRSWPFFNETRVILHLSDTWQRIIDNTVTITWLWIGKSMGILLFSLVECSSHGIGIKLAFVIFGY